MKPRIWLMVCWLGIQPLAHADLSIVAEWIEVELSDFHQLVAMEGIPLEGKELRHRVERLVQDEKATILQSLTSRSSSGQRTKVEAIREFGYHTEYSPPSVNDSGKILPPVPSALETRNLGYTLEYDASVDGDMIEASVNLESIMLTGMRKWGQEQNEIEMPDFFATRGVTSCRLHDGVPILFGSFDPAKSTNPERKSPRVLVFIRGKLHGETPDPVAEALTEAMSNKDLAEARQQIADAFALEEIIPLRECLSVVIEVIATKKERLNGLLMDEKISTRGPELRRKLLNDLKQGKAKLVETLATIGKSGQRIKIESGLELMWPTEYDPAEISENGKWTLPSHPAAFETTNTGFTFELTPTVHEEQWFEFKGGPTFVTYRENVAWRKAESRVEMPIFHTQSISSQGSFSFDEPSFLGTLRPPTEDKDETIHAIFLRAELLP